MHSTKEYDDFMKQQASEEKDRPDVQTAIARVQELIAGDRKEWTSDEVNSVVKVMRDFHEEKRYGALFAVWATLQRYGPFLFAIHPHIEVMMVSAACETSDLCDQSLKRV